MCDFKHSQTHNQTTFFLMPSRRDDGDDLKRISFMVSNTNDGIQERERKKPLHIYSSWCIKEDDEYSKFIIKSYGIAKQYCLIVKLCKRLYPFWNLAVLCNCLVNVYFRLKFSSVWVFFFCRSIVFYVKYDLVWVLWLRFKTLKTSIYRGSVVERSL